MANMTAILTQEMVAWNETVEEILAKLQEDKDDITDEEVDRALNILWQSWVQRN